jgi:porin
LEYNQILADGKISIQIGEYANDVRFVGSQVGGYLATGSLGPQAVIPFEVGLSFAGFGTPAAEIKFNIPGDFYDRAGVQQSVAPGGGNAEVKVNPGVGLKFAPVGTRALFINEFGYEKAASASQEFTWIRVGGIYNTTQFRNFSNGQNAGNWAVYALWDRQLTSLSKKQSYRGLYVGASVMYAPPEQNLFSQYYEARIYDIGPFDARPGDFASLVIFHETYSREGQEALAPTAFGSNDATSSVIGSYAFHVRPGIYVQPGLGLTTNPSVSHFFNNSFDVYLSLTAYL